LPTNVISITDGQIFLENDLFTPASAAMNPAFRYPASVAPPRPRSQEARRRIRWPGPYRELGLSSLRPTWTRRPKQLEVPRGTEMISRKQYLAMSWRDGHFAVLW